MARNPPKNDPTDVYIYDPNDDQRAHIMPFGKSPRGSLAWYVTDVKTGTDRWIERRDLSDRILVLWKNVTPSPQGPASRSPFRLYSHNKDLFCLPLFLTSASAIALLFQSNDPILCVAEVVGEPLPTCSFCGR